MLFLGFRAGSDLIMSYQHGWKGGWQMCECVDVCASFGLNCAEKSVFYRQIKENAPNVRAGTGYVYHFCCCLTW